MKPYFLAYSWWKITFELGVVLIISKRSCCIVLDLGFWHIEFGLIPKGRKSDEGNFI